MEGHHKGGHREVGDGEGDDEVVGHTVKRLIREDRQDDEDVPDNGATYARDHETGGDGRLDL